MPVTAKKTRRAIHRRKTEARCRERVARMTPAELGKVARAMVAAAEKDPAEANRLQERLVRGFYGDDE